MPMRTAGPAWVHAICVFLALALSPVFAASPAAAPDDRPHLSSDPRVNRARAMIEGGRFVEALQVLRPLVPEDPDRPDAPDHPDRTDVLFLVGLAALGAAQLPEAGEREQAGFLDEAVAALHAILVDRPDLVRVRLELARAFFLKGDDSLSREHFGRVLAGGPPLAMAANIRRHLESIRARRRWSGRFGATLAPDSNLNAASDAGVIRLYGLPFRRDSDAGARSGLGMVLWGGGEYRHPLSGRLRLRVGADAARREYGGSEFDGTFLSAHAGPHWPVGRAAEIGVLGSVRRRFSGGEPHSRESGVRLEATRRFGGQVAGNGRASWHRRDHDRDRHLDGSRTALSLGVLWRATPTAQAEAAAGYSAERTRAEVWRNAGRWARLGVTLSLRRGWTAGADAEFARTDYEGNWAPFVAGGGARKDETRILRVSAFHRAFTVSGFSPRLVLVHEDRRSNAQLYDYRRRRAELQFVRQF
ncbi:MAG: surface lipoprotein assembly modifier [Gammaproteobacteria bacterium]|nr:surface lipoprotein assembly modifier [Gammaproteobacteria bacterium]